MSQTREQRNTYVNNYIKKRYKEDPEFREKFKKRVRENNKKRWKDKTSWYHKNREIFNAYQRGYRAGKRKALKEVAPKKEEKGKGLCVVIDKEIEELKKLKRKMQDKGEC